MKENSIEEDIKIINNFITYFNKNIQNGNKADLIVLGEEINALEHILSDYKRVLEMNEVLLKENEKLRGKIDINISYAEYLEKILNECKKESILKQKVKNMIKEKEWALENYDCDKSDYKQSQAIGAWNILQKLLKESEE